MKIVFIGLLLGISLANCSCSNIKLHPEYAGVDPRVVDLVNEYKELAKTNGITFNKEVTIGFKTLNKNISSGLTKRINSEDDNNIIGMCYYGLGWREIYISEEYWKNASAVSKKTLLEHELAHCYCNRDHDFEGKIPYPETYKDRDAEITKMIQTNKILPAYYDDFCARSIMYPEILEDYCIRLHREDYEKELVSDCKVW